MCFQTLSRGVVLQIVSLISIFTKRLQFGGVAILTQDWDMVWKAVLHLDKLFGL